MCRVKEPRRTLRRHSNFYIGLHGWSWVESLQLFTCETKKLMALSTLNSGIINELRKQQGLSSLLSNLSCHPVSRSGAQTNSVQWDGLRGLADNAL